jgi:GNAT superfamily N-acetyltransferase
MLRWIESRVDDPVAHELLTEYFDSRAAGFPRQQGRYRTTFPVPDDFIAPHGIFLVAVDDDDTQLGCGGIRRLESAGIDIRRYEVKHLYLRRTARGQGSGRALLAELERRARAFDATELVLDTNASLEAAGSLYRSSGYHDIPPYNENPNATNWYRKIL